MHLQLQVQQSVVQVHLCLAVDWQQTQLSAANNGGLLLRTFERISLIIIRCFEREVVFF